MTRQRRLLSATVVLAFVAGWVGLASIAETAEDAVEHRLATGRDATLSPAQLQGWRSLQAMIAKQTGAAD